MIGHAERRLTALGVIEAYVAGTPGDAGLAGLTLDEIGHVAHHMGALGAKLAAWLAEANGIEVADVVGILRLDDAARVLDLATYDVEAGPVGN